MKNLTISLDDGVFKKSKNYFDPANCPIAIAVNSMLKKEFLALVGGYDIAIYQRRRDDDKTLDKVAECISIPINLIEGAKNRKPAEAEVIFNVPVELFVRSGKIG